MSDTLGPSGGTPDAALRGEWLPICNSADVSAGQSRGFVVAGERLVVWRNASEAGDNAGASDTSTDVHVWRDLCPHRGAQLSLGAVTGGVLVSLTMIVVPMPLASVLEFSVTLKVCTPLSAATNV